MPDRGPLALLLGDVLRLRRAHPCGGDTWLVDRLEEHGLAERRAHPGDRRIRTVALTRKGAKIRSQVEARMYEAPDNLRSLSMRDLEALAKILRKVAPTDHHNHS